ncbi:hypothetical protein LVJ94_04785 [Pendulispora rubella]|uniref:MoxR-vWA-beta-propeller ternary system domain-containing protein n=1 Tax=Pendulispora rubella TaxID=2741070 RepID=A0ABZ2L707_9BACT
MLERIALHQTRLRTPGLGLDAKGVALGAKGLVLLPSIDRLVALLAVYTQEHSLEDLMPSLEIQLVRSKLGTREMTLSFAAESSDRMDRMAETARLTGGFTFTGTNRHFVQYRDAAAPFGYDTSQLLATDAALSLYHDRFTQAYEFDRLIELRALLLRLMPHADPSTYTTPGTRYLVAEPGLGPALIHYLVRSRVEGEVAVGEWPPASAFDEGPIRRTIVRVPELPERMRPLMQSTPGIVTFFPVGPGVAVEAGYRHPVQLRACPVFDPKGLVLLRGRDEEPWVLPQMPQMGDLRVFARIELRTENAAGPATAQAVRKPESVRVPLRVTPSTAPWRGVTASWIKQDEIPLLRRLAYALPRETVQRTQIAVTQRGAFLRASLGIEAIPLGTFFVEIHPNLYIPAGYDVTPAVAPEVLYRALGAPASQVLFVTPNEAALAIEASAFVPLELALIEAKPWDPLVADTIEAALAEAPIDLRVEPLGAFPMSGVESPTAPETQRDLGSPQPVEEE